MKANRYAILCCLTAAALLLAGCAPLPPLVPTAEPATVAPAAPTAEVAPTAALAAGLTPPSAEVCNGMAQVLMQAVGSGVEVVQTDHVDMADPATGASGAACRAEAKGTGRDFAGPDAVIKAITDVLVGGGWQEDMQLASGGPTGMGAGFRSGEITCMAAAIWQPDPSVNCPNDKPISACALTPEQKRYTVTVDCATEATSGGAGMANPASANCIDKGGKLEIETRGDGGQIGVCYFEDNRQCEEWALLRGECPIGGVKVTGYVTEAARYCAITGGEYAITGMSGAADEQGTCALPGGATCDAWDYYNGKCDATTEETSMATPSGEARVALKDAAATLAPAAVFERFYDLTQIPRPSGHVEQVRAFIADFGNKLNLETTIDAAGNVLIRKPASPGMEDRPTVILQGHMDMVPQKTPESRHDFAKDPIDAYMQDGWIAADGTTLGADDGIGVALALAVLQSETLAAGPIEALFTVDEETTMAGANGLGPGELKGRILINLDSETEGEFTIGSAGGEHVDVAAALAEVAAPAGAQGLRVTVAGLTGGHSGVDIDKGRGHAIQLLVRLLGQAAGPFDLALADISGGSAPNAIPREAAALVAVPADKATAFLAAVADFGKTVQGEYAATDPGLAVTVNPVEAPARVLAADAQAGLLAALSATPQGVIAMSPAVPGLVQTSNNVGILKAEDGALSLTCFPRSSVDADLDAVAETIAAAWQAIGAEVTASGQFSGWNPNPGSPILTLMKQVYADKFGAEPKVGAIHAGLECGAIAATYPGMDAISIGPTLRDVHTPGERLEVASVEKLYALLVETLMRVK